MNDDKQLNRENALNHMEIDTSNIFFGTLAHPILNFLIPGSDVCESNIENLKL